MSTYSINANREIHAVAVLLNEKYMLKSNENEFGQDLTKYKVLFD